MFLSKTPSLPKFFVPAILLLFGLTACLGLVTEAFAQSSLGLGRAEQAIRPEGYFAGILFWIQQQQQSFYKALIAALTAMRESPAGVWGLVTLSFLYGIFHAAGPGHGKAVISSYMLANEVAARRGIVLSFMSALLQGVTAIVVIGVLFFFLRGAGIKSSELSGFLEITSYFFVMLLGAYLIWRKLLRPSRVSSHDHGHTHNHDHSIGHAHTHVHTPRKTPAFAHNHAYELAPAHAHSHGHTHSHGHHHGCDECGHSHAADPSTLEGELNLREAWTAILAVGLRPCTGAIIVLTFAFLNGMYFGGILSTLAMSVGTGITVSALALLAVGAKGAALKFAGLQEKTAIVHRVIEVGGAFLVFFLGLLLFSAALTA